MARRRQRGQRASCVTDCDYDAAYIDALKRHTRLREDFTALTADEASPLAVETAQFAKFWPVFNTKELRARNVFAAVANTREEAIHYYLQHRIYSYSPRCWQKHNGFDQPLPIDWPHTLSALYQVRCNFFHGGKMLNSEGDQQIVFAAYMTLLTFLEQGRYLE